MQVRRLEMNPMDRHPADDLISQYLISSEPYYRATGNEIELYDAAYAVRMPMMLKGPTGCGKTRFVEYMAWRLGKPLVTIACHEDMTASDLVGRHLLDARRHALAGRPAHHRGAPRRHLLSGRDRRGAPGHHRGDPSAHRRTARAAAGEEGGAGACAPGFPARDLLQPRLPEHHEGPQAVDQAEFRRTGLRLAARERRDRDRRARIRRVTRHRRAAGEHRRALRATSRVTVWTRVSRRAC